ncbi:hypothetical protein BRD00_00515 [Halobacteriales archaeon QS_8_69_26]|nr:MAG: hypothetical protein BRD00_00515 [Halobacteriales archaeon QS_8_69_26]
MTIADRAEREVVEFHEFIEDWLAGRIPDDDGTYDRARSALADDFEITSPSGETRSSAAILGDMEAAHGSAGDDFSIRVADLDSRFAFGDEAACLVTYEEHQRPTPGAAWTERYSTAVFRAADDAPNGVEWIHLHETWLPDGAPGGE